MKRNTILILCAVSAAVFQSCDLRFPDEELGMTFITNETQDTLLFTSTMRASYHNLLFLPGETRLSACGYGSGTCILDNMEANPQIYSIDTVRILRHDSVVIQWIPPIRDMGDTHSCYNRLSWRVEPKYADGYRDYYVSYFTITEADFGANY